VRNFLRLSLHAGGRAFVGKRGLVLGLLSALPIALAWIQVENDPRVNETEFVGVMLLVFQFVVPLAGLFFGVAVLGDEIEGRTLTYLFTRPHPRPLVFLARYFGLATAFGLLLLGTVAVTSYIYASKVPITARQVAGTPKRSMTGWAQWWPVRMAMPSRSRMVPTSWGWMPSIANERTPAFSFAVPISRTPFTSVMASVALRRRLCSCAAIRGRPRAST